MARYLVDNDYHLTALEFFCETYEKTGRENEQLSQFFEDSANFLMFEDMKSVSEISSSLSDGSFLNSDAMRIKDDRIAVLEHELRVVRDALEEAQQQLHAKQSALVVDRPPPCTEGPSTDAEDAAVIQLIGRFLQSRGLKLSSLAFSNETKATRGSAQVPDDVDLVHLLRAYQGGDKTAQASDEVERLRAEKEKLNSRIVQLSHDMESARQQITTLTNSANTKTRDSKRSSSSATPSVELLDILFGDMMQIMNVIDPSERRRIVRPLQTIARFHPVKETRERCILLVLNLWEDPDEEQRAIIVRALAECCDTKEKIEGDVLPAISSLTSSDQPNMLRLASAAVAALAPRCSAKMRSSLLLSVIRQLSENDNPDVRLSAATDGAALIKSMSGDSDATDKLKSFLALSKQFLFDEDNNVQSASMHVFLPALFDLTSERMCMGKGFCEYWLKEMFSLGSASSRYKLCAKVVEMALKRMIPNQPKKGQQLVGSGSIPAPELVIIPKPEYDWIATSLVPQLPKFASFLFSGAEVKHETDRFVAGICKRLGQKFTGESIVPEFLTAIDKGENSAKQMTTTLLMSAVAPSCDPQTFLTQARNFLTYATNELRGFCSQDIPGYITPAFALLADREPEKRSLLFTLTDELSKSSRAAIRRSAVVVLTEIIPSLDNSETEKNVLPILTRLSSDQDESLVLEVITCVGAVAKFSSAKIVLQSVREMFELWLSGATNLQLQSLCVLSGIVADVDLEFRDKFILPKLLVIVNQLNSCEEQKSREEGLIIVVDIISSLSDVSDEVVNLCVVPLIRELCESGFEDGRMEELKKRYNV